MATIGDFEHLLPSLSRGEKTQIPGIDSRPDVCGGEPCIVRTRIPVWLLERARQLGTSERELLEAYPSLGAEDLVNAWAYVRSHGAEISTQIEANESAGDGVRLTPLANRTIVRPSLSNHNPPNRPPTA